MSEAPLVTVIVLSWNRRDQVLQCLASLARLDYAARRVVVVDNASADGSPAATDARVLTPDDRPPTFDGVNPTAGGGPPAAADRFHPAGEAGTGPEATDPDSPVPASRFDAIGASSPLGVDVSAALAMAACAVPNTRRASSTWGELFSISVG